MEPGSTLPRARLAPYDAYRAMALSDCLPPGALWNRLARLALAGTAVVVLLTFADYGVTWDEDLLNWNGNLTLDYYLSILTGGPRPSWAELYKYGDLYNYGSLFDMTAAAFNRLSPLGVYETRHLLNAIVGIVGLAGCWKLGRALGGPRAGAIALLLLLMTPNYYGQVFNNPKDIPFAAAGAWAAYYIIRILPRLPRPPLRLVGKLGLAIGMALGIRVGGLLFLCYLGLMLGLSALWQAVAARRPAVVLEAGWTSLWRVLLPTAAISTALMLLLWPWAQHDPIGNPLRALMAFSHQLYPYSTLFDGRFVSADDPPWEYLPTYIVLQLPELVLALLIAAVPLAAVDLARRGIAQRREKVLGLFLLGYMIVFPVAYAIAIKAALFDGMRHFIFLLPLIAVAAALVADRAFDRIAASSYRGVAYAALALYGVAHAGTMVMLHPDQYVYYNALIGGADGAERRFKLDYWANSYAEDVRGLEAYLRKEYGPAFAQQAFTVGVCGPPTPAKYYFPPNFRLTQPPDSAQFFIAFTKDNCDRALAGHPIYRVERMGALLSVVLDRRAVLDQAAVAGHPPAGIVPPRAAGSASP